MKIRNLTSLVLGGALVLSSCDASRVENSAPSPQYQILRGKPLSVASGEGWPYAVFEVQGKKILGEMPEQDTYSPRTASAALLQSEINDGDDDEVEIYGVFLKRDKINREVFSISSLKVQGYRIDFARSDFDPFVVEKEEAK